MKCADDRSKNTPKEHKSRTVFRIFFVLVLLVPLRHSHRCGFSRYYLQSNILPDSTTTIDEAQANEGDEARTVGHHCKNVTTWAFFIAHAMQKRGPITSSRTEAQGPEGVVKDRHIDEEGDAEEG